ncbi:ABC transporter substrate-binding protein [candidate division KSB3 bacterium]|uniref:ABC transporter substrate-binding protein n=1 Tax=candidate division KSB3 bacterium TaxID=2044937 RepID=A0A9D5JX22_9BACT|nr:ABC transporter substrate-binding protein [candidate division KSB3 bacterium]MBD3325884.1 ABC transporter substrate-binding protein [candidate division KSB3 bacterium]
MSTKRRHILVSVITICMLVMSTVAFAEDEIIIGWYAALTGPGASAGEAMVRGSELAIEQINKNGGIDGVPLKLVTRDDKAQPAVAVTAIQELIQREKAVAIVGSYSSSCIMASMHVAQKFEVPLVGTNWRTECSTLGNEYYFRATGFDALACATAATFVVEHLGWEKIAIIHENDPFGTGGKDDFVAALKYWDMEPLIVESYTRADKDFSAQISNIIKADPDGVVFWGLYLEGALLIKQLRELGYEGNIISANSVIHRDFLEIAGEQARNNHMFVTPWIFATTDPNVLEVLKLYEEKYGEPAHHDTVSRGWDAVHVIAEGMRTAEGFDPRNPNTPESRNALKEAMHEIDGLELMGGTYYYAQSPEGTSGEGLKSLRVVAYIDGTAIAFDPGYTPAEGAVLSILEGYK